MKPMRLGLITWMLHCGVRALTTADVRKQPATSPRCTGLPRARNGGRWLVRFGRWLTLR